MSAEPIEFRPSRSGCRPNEWSMGMARQLAEALGDEKIPDVFYQPLVVGVGFMPLEIGASDKLRAMYPSHDAKKLQQVLAKYCRSRTYLSALYHRRPRCGLDGRPVGAVEEGHAVYAGVLLRQWGSKAEDDRCAGNR